MFSKFPEIVAMPGVKELALSLALVISLGYGCTRNPQPVPTFDGERAFGYLEEQVAFGPRVPGSGPWSACRAYYCNFFTDLGLAVDSQVFDFLDPYSSRRLPLVNLIVPISSHKADADRIVLMAHWDSRPRTDYASDPPLKDHPIDGANDGASGVAVLMELALLLAQQPPPCHVDLVLVDGEDWGKPSDLDFYLLGSREFARRGIRDTYRFGIVIDMIGDKDQQIYREGYSERYHQELNDMIWSTAARLGITTFRDSVKHLIHDDHLSLCSGGVPTVDIIDFDYPYWHTEFDSPDKCSAESLANVGRVLIEIVYDPALWPKN